MTGIDYFRMPCSISDDMAELEAEYGVKAFAVIVRLWQKIYSEKGYYCEWTDRSPLLFLAKYFGGNSGLELNLIKEIVKKAVEVGIFDARMYERHGILTSEEIQNHYLFATKRRTNRCLENDYLLVKVAQNQKNESKNDGIVNKNDEIVDRKGQRKVKESKGKDSKEDMSEQTPTRPKAEPSDTHPNQPANSHQLANPYKLVNPLPTKDGRSYEPDVSHMEEWRKLYPDVDIVWEFRKMKGWIGGSPERKKTMRGMNRFVNSWLARAQDDVIERKKKAMEMTRKNKFQNFAQRSYDDDDLERRLVAADG